VSFVCIRASGRRCVRVVASSSTLPVKRCARFHGVSPRAPDPARRFGRVDDDVTVRRAVDSCESRGLSYGLPRSFVATSRHVAWPARVVRGRCPPKPKPEVTRRCDGYGMDAGAWSGAQRGVLIIVYGTCATNRMSCLSRVLNTQVM